MDLTQEHKGLLAFLFLCDSDLFVHCASNLLPMYLSHQTVKSTQGRSCVCLPTPLCLLLAKALDTEKMTINTVISQRCRTRVLGNNREQDELAWVMDQVCMPSLAIWVASLLQVPSPRQTGLWSLQAANMSLTFMQVIRLDPCRS